MKALMHSANRSLTLILTIALLWGSASVAQAYHEEVLVRNRIYFSGDQLVRTFSPSTYIEKLMVQAEGRCRRGTVTAEVYVDGVWSSKLVMPCTDPLYPVMIRANVREVMITFTGTVKVHKITAYKNGRSSNSWEVHPGSTAGEAAQLTLDVVSNLQEVAMDADFDAYLKPIRKAAMRLSASEKGRTQSSIRTSAKARKLVEKIQAAQSYLETLVDGDFYVEPVEALWAVSEILSDLYDL